MRCAVVGLGEFGRAMAVGLARYGYEVLAIDRDKARINRIKDEVALAVCVDSMDEDALRELGVAQMDVLVAGIGENFEAQVLVVVYARRLGVKRIVARATSPAHMQVLKAVGADEVFNPEEEAAQRVVQRIVLGNLEKFFDLADGFSLIEVKASKRLAGKTLRALALRNRYRINVVGIHRLRPSEEGGQPVEIFDPVPGPDETIQEGDRLTIVGSVLDLARFMGDYGMEKKEPMD